MEWIIAHAAHIGAVFSAIASAWAFFTRVSRMLRRAVIETVRESFASKADLARLETKVDTMLELTFIGAQAQRKSIQSQPTAGTST